MEIKITNYINEEGEITSAFNAAFEGKIALGLGYDEMLGLTSAIAMPKERPCLHWLKTPEQLKAWDDFLKQEKTSHKIDEIQEVDFENELDNENNTANE